MMVANCCPQPLYMTRRNEQQGGYVLDIKTVLEGGQNKTGNCGVSFAEEVKTQAEQGHCEGFPESGEPAFSNDPH